VIVGGLGWLWRHPGNKWEVSSSLIEGILRSIGSSLNGEGNGGELVKSGTERWTQAA
jgi:hypothetical protein